ncbi:MAG: YggS family pyridoxal phosphate-dependent enzyme [Peptoniphilus sp.]|nr:YggS family pyridoxal phosphate-dependent enzyme [Peptoniphilus sp.]
MNLSDNLKNILEDIERAKERSKLHQEVKLIGVSKHHSVDEILEAYNAGLKDFGENRVQELREKIDLLPDDINFHMIGNFQTNKVKYIYDKVALIQSVDRLNLIEEIDKRASKDHITVDVLIQVNISREEQKGGVLPEKLPELIEKAIEYKNIRIKGLMGMGPLTEDHGEIRKCFRELFNLRESIKNRNYKEIDMDYLSMGMSGDFEIAIEEGSNMVRVGTKIFGSRK